MILTPNQQEVLGYLLEEKRPVEYAEIQAATGMGASTVSRAVKSLERMGEVHLSTYPSPSGRGRRIKAIASRYSQGTLFPEPKEDWAAEVPATARDVYAAVLELAPNATIKALTEYLHLGRSVVNKACLQLEAVGALLLDTRVVSGHRSVLAVPNVGAGDAYRDFQVENIRPDWAENLRDSAIELYRILYRLGPSRLGDILALKDWTYVKSTTVDSMRALVEVGAVTYRQVERLDGHGGPVREYTAVQGPYTDADKKAETKALPKREGPAFGEVYKPPTKGKVRYRKLGRG